MSIQLISLKRDPFKFAEVPVNNFALTPADKSIYYRSQREQEDRRAKANATLDARDAAISEIRDKLDQSEWAEFDKDYDTFNNRISELISFGDTGDAIEVANEVGRKFINDSKWKNKAAVKAERDKWIDEAKKNGFNDLTVRRMEDENPYYDDGTGKFKHGNYNKAVIEGDLATAIASWTPNRQESHTSSVTSDGYGFSKDGNMVKSPIGENNTIDPTVNLLYKATNTISGGKTVTELTIEDLMDVFDTLYKTPEVYKGYQTLFDDMQWLYQHANKVLNDPNATELERKQAQEELNEATTMLQSDNGIIVAGTEDSQKIIDSWARNRMQKLLEERTYRHVSTNSTRSNGIDYNIGGKTGGGNNQSSGGLLGSIFDMFSGTSKSYNTIETGDEDYNDSSAQGAPSAGMAGVTGKPKR